MGAFDKFKDKAKDLVENQGDKIADGVDKATDFIDDKTGGKYTDKLDKVDEMAAKLDKSDDDDEGEAEVGAET